MCWRRALQRSGNRVRVNVQLIDAETDSHLWAERFDRATGDLFALQNEITGRIANTLNLELIAAEAARPTEHPDALDYILRGRRGFKPNRQHARRLRGRAMFTIGQAPQRHRIALFFGAVGVASLFAVALPRLTAAGDVAPTAAAANATVKIDNFAFLPATLTVTPGTTVTWKNEDDSPHRIGDKNGTFTSAALDTDDTFSHTFAHGLAESVRVQLACLGGSRY
jgi:plastocyanin